MNLAELAVKHRVTVAMCVLVVVLLGLVSYGRIPIDLLPDLNFPIVAIVTSYSGAAPQEIEALISRPLEEVVGTVPNVKDIQSVSTEENSVVIAQFNWGTDMDFAALNVREKVDLIKRAFPSDVMAPMVVKFDPSMMPVMVVSMTGGQDQVELRSFAVDSVKKRLERIDGVASVEVVGGQEAQIRVTIDPDKLNAHSLPWSQVALAVRTASLNLPGGKISEDGKDYLIRSVGGVSGLDELGNVIVGADLPTSGRGIGELSSLSGLNGIGDLRELAGLSDLGAIYGPSELPGGAGQSEDVEPMVPGTGLPGVLPQGMTGGLALPSGGAGDGAPRSAAPVANPASLTARPILLKDIATIERVISQSGGISRLNGEDSVSLVIQKSSQANTVKVANLVGAALGEVKPDLPANTQIVTTANQATFIAEAIGMVKSSALQGGALAILILVIFLRSFASTLIIALSIPISIVFAVTLMFFSHLTLNLMTLAGLALGVGMLVDNSIVVLENIFRRMEEGERGVPAAINGTKEVAMAITASTLTTVAVFLPVVFVGGISGQLFSDLALTVTYSLMASLIVAMTLVPALAVTLYRNRPPRLQVEKGTLISGYRRSLLWTLRNRLAVVGVTTVLLALSIVAIPRIGREFIPDMDRGELTANIQMPVGSSLDQTDALARQVEAAARELPEIRYVTVTTGSGGSGAVALGGGEGLFGGSADTSTITVKVAPQRERARSIGQIIADLRARIVPVAAAANATITFEQSGFIVGGILNPVEVVLKGSDIEQLRSYASTLAADMRAIPGMNNVGTDFRDGRPELRITFDRTKLTKNGVVTLQAAQLVKAAFSGENVGTLLVDGESLSIRMEYPAERRNQAADLAGLTLVTPMGSTLKLGDVATITDGSGPETLRRMGGERTVSVTAGLDKLDLNAAIAAVQAKIDARGLPAGISAEFGGENKEMQDAFSGLTVALWLSLALVYAVMASQFENLLHPFIIMFTMPMAAIGVVAALYFGHLTISIPSVIGVITLAGVVVNNGIVMVDFINQRRREGMERERAVVDAAALRLRPILMTSLTTILGLLPMAFVRGEGTELTRPLGMTLMSGLTASTLLTLYVLPIVYIWVDGFFGRRGATKRTATSEGD